MTRQTSLDEITLDDLAVVRADIAAAVAVLPRCRATQRGLLHSLHTLCYQLGVVDEPPEHGNARHTSLEQRMAIVPQPVVREGFVRYLRIVSTTLRPKTVESRAASLALFGTWLGEHHPQISTLSQLSRAHLEDFLGYDASRACRGRVAGSGRTISVSHHARAIRDLRSFFDDITIWGWADRPRPWFCTAATFPAFPHHCPELRHPTSTEHSWPPFINSTMSRPGLGSSCCAAPDCGWASCSISSWTACGSSPAMAPG